jgi:hypothetical protein
MRTTLAATLLAVVGLFIVGVGFGATVHSTAKGTLTGGIIFTGRIPPGYAKTGYQRGLVQMLRGGKVVARARLAQGQAYRFALSPHKYKIRTWGNAKPPYPPCPLVIVRIRAGHTTRAIVTCTFH